MVPHCDVFPVESCLEEATAKEQSWVQHALPLLETELATGDIIAWAAYHASMQPVVEDPPALLVRFVMSPKRVWRDFCVQIELGVEIANLGGE